MLVRWTASRTASHLRWDALKMTSKRTLSYHKTYRQTLPWTAKIWCGKDGTPRPFFKWALYGTTLVVVTWQWRSLEKVREDLKKEYCLLLMYSNLEYLQRHKSDLSSLDTSDFQASLARIRALFLSAGGSFLSAGELITNLDLEHVFDQSRDLSGSSQEKVHAIIVEGLRELDDILSSGKEDDPMQTAIKISAQMMKIYREMRQALAEIDKSASFSVSEDVNRKPNVQERETNMK
ncbi:hypothetical protein E4T56_gene16098 [Termitomyces sp. T112]|nr:hypothetical protein E4T56_gene16098 [Termitomyces sp. T112]